MKKKCLLILNLVIILCVSSIIQVFASEGSDLISKEEFVNSMTEIYEKYDLNFEVIDDSNYSPIIREEFESELIEIEKDLIDNINDANEKKEEYLRLKEDGLSNDIEPQAMFIDSILLGERTVKHSTGLAYVNIEFMTEMRWDGSNGQIVSVKNPGSWYKESYLNCEDVIYSEREWSIINQRTQVLCIANGIAVFEYTHPSTGMKIGAEQPFSILRTFTVEDGI